jgi:hypothetical protein
MNVNLPFMNAQPYLSLQFLMVQSFAGIYTKFAASKKVDVGVGRNGVNRAAQTKFSDARLVRNC